MLFDTSFFNHWQNHENTWQFSEWNALLRFASLTFQYYGLSRLAPLCVHVHVFVGMCMRACVLCRCVVVVWKRAQPERERERGCHKFDVLEMCPLEWVKVKGMVVYIWKWNGNWEESIQYISEQLWISRIFLDKWMESRKTATFGMFSVGSEFGWIVCVLIE